jgi:hypothetical protein
LLFTSCPAIIKVCTYFFYFLRGNSLKLCMVAYHHVENRLSFQHIYRTIFEWVIALFLQLKFWVPFPPIEKCTLCDQVCQWLAAGWKAFLRFPPTTKTDYNDIIVESGVNHQKPKAALLVASMCLDFKIHEKQLWNGVIQQILSFGLVSIKDFIFEHWILCRVKFAYRLR